MSASYVSDARETPSTFSDFTRNTDTSGNVTVPLSAISSARFCELTDVVCSVRLPVPETASDVRLSNVASDAMTTPPDLMDMPPLVVDGPWNANGSADVPA